MKQSDIIIGPIITEKSMKDASKGRYAFKVGLKANKYEIKKVIEDKFNVNIVKISTMITKGRTAKAGIKRLEINKPNIKKAFVQVKKDQKIAIFDLNS